MRDAEANRLGVWASDWRTADGSVAPRCRPPPSSATVYSSSSSSSINHLLLRRRSNAILRVRLSYLRLDILAPRS